MTETVELLKEELVQLEKQHQDLCNVAQQTAGIIIYIRNKIAQLQKIDENKSQSMEGLTSDEIDRENEG